MEIQKCTCGKDCERCVWSQETGRDMHPTTRYWVGVGHRCRECVTNDSRARILAGDRRGVHRCRLGRKR